MRKEAQFRKWLLLGHTVKATNSRIYRGNKAEKILKIELDDIVLDDQVMKESIQFLKDLDSRGNLQNVLRLYYFFINGKEFPLLYDSDFTKISIHFCYSEGIPFSEFISVLKDVDFCTKNALSEIVEKRVSSANVRIGICDKGSFISELFIEITKEAIKKLVHLLCEKFNKKSKKYKAHPEDQNKVITININKIEIKQLTINNQKNNRGISYEK